MIWNPWREIRLLRKQVELLSEMLANEAQKNLFLQSDKEFLLEKIKEDGR